MSEPFPWRDDALPAHVVDAAKRVAMLPTFVHHLAKASIERWVAFELAAVLDEDLRGTGWTSLVECGGATGLGNVDLMLVPSVATITGSRLRPQTAPWPQGAIAIEIKCCHLADGESGYRFSLVSDLMAKPALAVAAGRPCERWLGLLITTDGLWQGSPNVAATAARAEQLRLGHLQPAPPLVVVASV